MARCADVNEVDGRDSESEEIAATAYHPRAAPFSNLIASGAFRYLSSWSDIAVRSGEDTMVLLSLFALRVASSLPPNGGLAPWRVSERLHSEHQYTYKKARLAIDAARREGTERHHHSLGDAHRDGRGAYT